jgi:hypothetical protein
MLHTLVGFMHENSAISPIIIVLDKCLGFAEQMPVTLDFGYAEFLSWLFGPLPPQRI